MTFAKRGDTVRVHYTGKLKDGSIFDSSREREPLRFAIGEARTLATFEEAVIGMQPGEIKTVDIPCHRAYGPHRKNMVRAMRRDLVPDGLAVQPGQRLRITLEDGQTTIATVVNVAGGDVMVDVNHPLAGEDLSFEIELVEIE
jgi:peptidylprolyl isomerase